MEDTHVRNSTLGIIAKRVCSFFKRHIIVLLYETLEALVVVVHGTNAACGLNVPYKCRIKIGNAWIQKRYLALMLFSDFNDFLSRHYALP